MSLTDKIRSIFSGQAVPALPELPSIYEHISAHAPERHPGLLDGGDVLPDDTHVRESTGFGWAPGALEGAFVRHTDPSGDDDQTRVERLHSALRRLADRPGARSRGEVTRLFHEGDARALLGALLNRLQEAPPGNQQRLYDEMRRMVLNTGHRDVLKFAMLILSVFGHEEDAELFTTIGRHEEFTFFSALAASNAVEDPRPVWLKMAQNVTGWGRIELTELLLDVESPEADVCAFLLRDGAANDIMGGYTALSIAQKCRLHQALEGEPDSKLIAGAMEILSTLAADAGGGGPDGDMFDYPEGGLATERLSHHFEKASDLRDFLMIDSIRSFAEADFQLEAMGACGWNPERIEQVLSACRKILGAPHWVDLAQEGLKSRDTTIHYNAMAGAKALGLPLRDHVKQRLEEEPLSNLWFDLVHEADEAQIDEALEMAARLLDLDAIATGPAEELGLGPEYQLHGAADWLLQELSRFPGKGWEVIRPALRSPVVRNRNMALNALANWPREDLTEEILQHLRQCTDDPDADVGNRCRELVASASG